jgi:hypothetical protein
VIVGVAAAYPQSRPECSYRLSCGAEARVDTKISDGAMLAANRGDVQKPVTRRSAAPMSDPLCLPVSGFLLLR